MRGFNPCFCRRWLPLWLVLSWGSCGFGAPMISEFLAANDSGQTDEDGEFSDWIEIHNPEDVPISLAGYHLTDNAADLGKWTFPAMTLSPGAYLVVFASGKDRVDPAAPLHTDFRLSAGGEYLALVAPDGLTVVSSFAPGYPPQFDDESFGIAQGESAPAWSFFSTPTPGAPNGDGIRAGPVIRALEPNPQPPVTGPLTITAQVVPANDPVATVNLYYRRMFDRETMLPMTDDGTGGDARAGDGIWTTVIPATAFGPGEMTRWRFVGADTRGSETEEPSFRAPVDSPRYFGTVARDERIRTALPVLHWFASNTAGAATARGSRGSVYYEGEFYDNVLFTLHGQSSSGFPKKSYNLDFNRPQRFRWSPEAPRVADIDLLTNWADKSKVRHVLAYEVMREAGVPAHFAYTVRVQQNGSFFSTADLVEDADEIYLERAGLNKDGALYKVYDNRLNRDAGDSGTRGIEKKTRRFEKNYDLQALINGLDLTGQALEEYLWDNIDIPRCVNMLAANSVIRNIDMHRKNWYIYCDTGRSDEWAILPWDLDLSHGRVWNTQNTYFDNALYTDGFVVSGTSIRLVAHLFANRETRAMIMRRIRTLSDRFLQPPPARGTDESELFYERRLNEQSALIDPPDIVPSDARLDFEKWGSWVQGGRKVPYTNPSADVETMAEAIQRWKTEYLPVRRRYIYGTQTVDHRGEIPLPQVGGGPTMDYRPLVEAGAPVKVLVPANGNLGLKWTGDPAFEPLSTAGWISGVSGVGYERAAGYESLIGLNLDTQMRENNSVYIRIEFDVADPAGFDRLELRMKYDDGFVAFLNGVLLAAENSPDTLTWNSAATRSQEANRNVFRLYDVTEKLAQLRPGRNVLAVQGLNESLSSSDMLFVPELHGGTTTPASTSEPRIDFGTIEVSPASGNQDEEFIQLLNPHAIAVDISDWRLTGGIEHTFLAGTVLPPGGALFVCPRAAAFRARTASPKGGEGLFVQGGYQGHLSSFGETLAIIDASGETNNTTTYPAQPSETQRSLVLSELMYHPSGDGSAEYIELLNTSRSVTLNLNGVRFTRGVNFDFTGSAITELPPGGRVLVVRDLGVFEAVHGANHSVAGAFANGTALNNGGEVLKLEDANNETICEFAYSDQPPWPAADGTGHSLVLIAPEARPDPALPGNWRSSVRQGGSPGWPEVAPFQGDPLDDADQNGESDLVDYALGNESGQPTVVPELEFQPDPLGGPSELRLSYPISLSAVDVEVVVLFSTDLTTWQAGGANLEFVSQEPMGDGRALVTWRVLPTLRNESRVFLRLAAVAP